MDGPKPTELRKLVGQHDKLVYEAVQAGNVAELSHDGQLCAQAIQEHVHLRHVHNALEFADLREGQPYEITIRGHTVSPLAHVHTHAAVKGHSWPGSTSTARKRSGPVSGGSAARELDRRRRESASLRMGSEAKRG